jgi:hypothetical protein
MCNAVFRRVKVVGTFGSPYQPKARKQSLLCPTPSVKSLNSWQPRADILCDVELNTATGHGIGGIGKWGRIKHEKFAPLAVFVRGRPRVRPNCVDWLPDVGAGNRPDLALAPLFGTLASIHAAVAAIPVAERTGRDYTGERAGGAIRAGRRTASWDGTRRRGCAADAAGRSRPGASYSARSCNARRAGWVLSSTEGKSTRGRRRAGRSTPVPASFFFALPFPNPRSPRRGAFFISGKCACSSQFLVACFPALSLE